MAVAFLRIEIIIPAIKPMAPSKKTHNTKTIIRIKNLSLSYLHNYLISGNGTILIAVFIKIAAISDNGMYEKTVISAKEITSITTPQTNADIVEVAKF